MSDARKKKLNLESDVFGLSKKPKSKTTKPDWTKAPKVGTQARTNWYIEHDLELDPTTPGFEDTDPSYKIIQGKYGPVSVIDDNPIPKKSPTKKSGFKMKKSSTKNYGKNK